MKSSRQPEHIIHTPQGAIYPEAYFEGWDEHRQSIMHLYGYHILNLLRRTGHDTSNLRTINALDIAGGEGFGAQVLREAGIDNVFSLDIDHDAHLRGMEENSGVHFIGGDALNLPFADDTFDVIIDSSGLASTSKIGDAFKEVRRVLKPDIGTYISIETTGKPRQAHLDTLRNFDLNVQDNQGNRVELSKSGQTIVVVPTDSSPYDIHFATLVSQSRYYAELKKEFSPFGVSDIGTILTVLSDERYDGFTAPLAGRAAVRALGKMPTNENTFAPPMYNARLQLLAEAGLNPVALPTIVLEEKNPGIAIGVDVFGEEYYARTKIIDSSGEHRYDGLIKRLVPVRNIVCSITPILAKKLTSQ